MKCPKCQFENLDGMNFCGKCGAKLEGLCPQCNFSNPAEYEFCGKCGQSLTPPSKPATKELSFDEKIDKIQRYLPKGLTEKILAQRDKIEGERKQVTVMFCDMEGFTPLVEKLGPEEAYGIMDQIYELLIHKVHDYGGTVNEMTGDGIVALFGAPIALEDAPQRAIRSALAVHREIAKFSDKLKQERKGLPLLRMRVGINTGPVVVGTLGNNLRVEFKAVGDTVNLASRTEALAEPGTTYVAEDTFKLTEGLFRFEALGEREIKGKEEPVKIYRVIAPSTRRTRFDVSAEQGLTPFVGRERELELLLDGFERAKQGLGQAFSIVSEAGVGKSRLLYEFRKVVANEDVIFLEGKCLSYSRGIVYHPIADLFKSNFNIREGDGDSEIIAKVKKGLKILGADEGSNLPYLLELLSVKDSGIDQIPMSPEARKDRMIETMIRIPLKGSEIRPLVLTIEDLHWIDNSSEDALKYLLECISGAKILLIFTYRPEFVHTWGGRSYHNQLNLNRLSNRESLSMANYLLDTKEIDRDLENLILEKTEGVPFFIEEFLKSLKDLKVIERINNRYHLTKSAQDLEIPSTIQDVIMARVDSLPEGAKEVLQTGSVIEREFAYELIKRVTGLSEKELLSNLSILKDSELLFERGIFPRSTYIFKHALAQEVVYDSILTRRKKKLHEEIGVAIEELFKDNIDEHYGVLAEHYIISERYEKGAEYCKFAGLKAAKGAFFGNAIPYGEKRVACLERLHRTEDVEKRIIAARTALGLYLNQMNYHIEAKEAVEPIVELALERDYKKRVSQIYAVIGTYSYVVEEDHTKTLKYLEDALKIAEELKDFLSLFLANYWLGTSLSTNCEFEKAIYHLEKVLEINVAANSLWGIAAVKAQIGYVYDWQGKIDLGYKASEEALRIAEETDDIFSKAHAYMFHGFSCYVKGFSGAAEEHLLRACGLSERINLFSHGAIAHMFLGNLYFDMGKYQESHIQYERAISLYENGRMFLSASNSCKIGSVKAKVMMNEKDINLRLLYSHDVKNKQKIVKGLVQRFIGEVLLNIDDQHMDEAENWINKSLEFNRRNGMMWHLGRDYALYAELFKRKGNQSKARKNLSKAIEILKECGADGWVEKYEKALAALS